MSWSTCRMATTGNDVEGEDRFWMMIVTIHPSGGPSLRDHRDQVSRNSAIEHREGDLAVANMKNCEQLLFRAGRIMTPLSHKDGSACRIDWNAHAARRRPHQPQGPEDAHRFALQLT